MRIGRRLLDVLVIVLTLIVGAAAASIIVSQTAWFKNWLRGYIIREANQYLNGTLSIQRLGGNLFFGIEMESVGVSMDGSEVVAVKSLGLSYSVFELLTRGLSVTEIRVDKPVIYLRCDGDGWSLSRLVKKQQTEAGRSGPGRPIAIDHIGISEGSVRIVGPIGTSGFEVPKRFDHLDAKLSFKYEPVRYSIEITNVSFRGSEPAIALNALSGGVAVKADTLFIDKLAIRTAETSLSVDGAVQQYMSRPVLNLKVSSDKLSIPEIARLVPSLTGVRLQPAFELTVDGALDRLGVELNARSSAGDANGKIVADLLSRTQSVEGTLSVRRINLAQVLNNKQRASDINADARFDVHTIEAGSLSDLDALRGHVSLKAPRASLSGYTAGPLEAKATIAGRRVDLDAKAAAYGVSATARGRVTLPKGSDPTAFDVRGQARNLDLRRLPRDLKVPMGATDVSAAYHVKGRGAAIDGDVRLDPSTVSGARIAGGSTVGITMRANDIGYSADATVSDLDLQRIGEEFKIGALADDRYKSSINGHFTATGRGTKPEEMAVTAAGELTDASILGGRIPRITFDASMANDTAHASVNGSFAALDPAVATGKPRITGSVGGRLEADATVTTVSLGVTPESVTATAKLDLAPSTVGGFEIARATLDGDYHDSTGDLRTLEISGRDLNVMASGALALNETGQSNLKLHADTQSLGALAKLAGASGNAGQALGGIAGVEATVTGNRRELQATGHVTAEALKYGGNGALTASSDFSAKLPNFDLDNGSLSAQTHATFLTLSGQNINQLDAKTDYSDKQVEFDATASQPHRSLALGGSLLLHPDREEVRLRSLNLQSQGVRWQTPAGVPATVEYGGDVITVKDLRLVNGDQQIAADGTFGRPGEALKIVFDATDVATFDALLLRPPQLSGRLNATTTVGGTKDAPTVQAEFTIDQGGFRQFRYDSFGGTVNYADNGVAVDAKLQQSPASWIVANGYAPVSLDAKRNQFDLHIDSSPIDIGLVQGFTMALTNVKGTLQARVDVTGTAGDPRPVGAITVQNAAFNVAPTGVSYTGLDGRIDLQPDKIHIDELRVLDNRRKQLLITGDLAIHEREIGGVTINVRADDFKVIDNKMGNLRVNSNLQIAGELSAPRVEGDLGLSIGTLNLDPILAKVSDAAYSTQETEYLTPQSGRSSRPSAFDALQMDVHMTVPNDLVIKADDIKAPEAPIGLGALNVTLGGELWASKAPWDQVRLVGTVNTIRGTYDFQGRRFTILRDGTVRFEGTDEIDPALDIRTQRIIQAVTANVNVRGTLTHPEIALSSTPPLDAADILSLVVFNQPINQLGEGQQISLAQRAQSMAIGTVAGQLAQSVGNALGVDAFEIDMAPVTGGGPSFAVGQQLGSNLYVKVQQGIGDASQTNFILEYELTNWLRFRSNVLQGSSTQAQLFRRMQGSGADLLFFFSY